MENILTEINSLWKMNNIFNIIHVLKYIVVFIPFAIFLIYKPAREYICYNFYNMMVKVLLFIYLLVPVSLNTIQIYLNYQINRGVIEVNSKLIESKLWLMRVIEKDTVNKLEKLERR